MFKSLVQAVTGGVAELRAQARSMPAASESMADDAFSLGYAGAADDEESQAKDRGDDAFIDLILAQQADGSFLLSDELAAMAEVASATLEQAAGKLALSDPDLARRVVATLAALHVLAVRYAERQVEWQMIADKAVRWVAGKANPPAGFADLAEWMKSVIERG